jgi:hypothetical protein
MEGVLAVYMRPRDPNRVPVCLDETSKQLTAESRVPIPMKTGRIVVHGQRPPIKGGLQEVRIARSLIRCGV